MRIGITYNLKSEIKSFPGDAAEELDEPDTVEAIRDVLRTEEHETFLLGGNLGIIGKIREWQVNFVFNIAEGFRGRNREAHIPAVLELLGIPYSGSDPLGLAATLDKSFAKRIALSLGIPTPEFWVLESLADIGQVPERFPLFVKPLWQGSSIGIRESSRVSNRLELEREAQRIFDDYGEEPLLVEEYVPGREITVGILGNRPAEILGLMEIAFQDAKKTDFCYSLEVKRNWRELVDYTCPARLGAKVEEGIRSAALRLFEGLRLRDICRFDFRVSPEGQFYFLEANPLPGLNPESGDIVLMAQRKGWSYRELILKMTHSAMSRYPRLNALARAR